MLRTAKKMLRTMKKILRTMKKMLRTTRGPRPRIYTTASDTLVVAQP